MTFKGKALAIALAAGIAGWVGPAAAAQGAAPAAIKISREASKAIMDLQTAVKGGDYASLPGKVAAANAAAKTADDRFAIARLQYEAAVAQKDEGAKAAAVDAMLATGRAPAELANALRIDQASRRLATKDYAGVSGVADQLLASDPNNVDAMMLKAESLIGLGRAADGVALMQKAIAAQTAAGKPVPKDWNKRLVGLAYNNKLPVAGELALAWVKTDPTPTNWRDAITIYQTTANVDEANQIDLYRLQRAAGALNSEADYYRYANSAATKGFPGEAKAVMEEGFASGKLQRNKAGIRELYASVSGKTAADKASLAASERSALSGSAARPALVTGDAYLGYGDYAKAAALYRAALGKSGVDKDMANLRLGIALARSGDKAGATAALSGVGGTSAPVAKLWLAWLGTQA